MRASNRMTVVAAFEDWKHGQSALHDLLRNGFAREQLGILARGGENWVWDAQERRQKSAKSNPANNYEAVGAGAEDLWSLGLAAGESSHLGPTIAGGSLTPVLRTDVALHDELTRRGIPEEDARYYEDQFQSGGTLVMANVCSRSLEVARIMEQQGARASLVACSSSGSLVSRN